MKLVTVDKDPIAVLHINYRPLDWFMESDNKRIKVELDNISLKLDDVINQEREEQIEKISQDPISNDNSDEVVEVFIDKKRKITDVIELLDSDCE